MVSDFQVASTPEIIFGSGKIGKLPALIEQYGTSVVLLTGKQSFVNTEFWDRLLLQFENAKIRWFHHVIDSEPTTSRIDALVNQLRSVQVEVVVAIGGGSVVDAGKAVSAMLCMEGSIKDYLEGVGTKKPTGSKIPFIAVPTTSGTGSETTKNAVISEVGDNGYKKSIRHDRYFPDVALVDPELTIQCPISVTAQSGMDAFTQLLESYLSTKANAFTDALAVDGMRKIRDGLVVAVKNGSDLKARENMAYASMLSGITLANAGLGTIHGFASSIGGYFDIPHGLICARLMLPVNKITIQKLRAHDPENNALSKFARIGKLFSKDKNAPDDYYIDLLLGVIQQYSEGFNIQGFAGFGMKEDDFEKIISATGNKNNPVALDENDMKACLSHALNA